MSHIISLWNSCCNQFVRVWEAAILWSIISDRVLQAENINQLLFRLLESLAPDQQQKLCMTLWCIWYR